MCTEIITTEHRARTVNLCFWNDGRVCGRAGGQVRMSPQRDDARPQTVVVVLGAGRLTSSLVVVVSRISCGRWRRCVERHRDDVHDHDAVPRHEHGHAARPERLSLEVQRHRAAAVRQDVEPTHNDITTTVSLVELIRPGHKPSTSRHRLIGAEAAGGISGSIPPRL